MLVYTASSCGVAACGISDTAPTVPWIVSSSVSPVNTRVVRSFSSAVSVSHVVKSFESGIFSGSQKFAVNLFQISRSFSSSIRFQLIASINYFSSLAQRLSELSDIPVTLDSDAMVAPSFNNVLMCSLANVGEPIILMI